ncbi:hypothetical protein [Streptosporangium sp. NPDC006930]|uniref:hypothetical protein n=1 Tax=Streptosporangium sp. NPDC006930 TaxID=3154783 RepID=UPI0034262F8F
MAVGVVVVSLGLLGVGLVGFFTDPLDLPNEVLEVLDKRASVISMFTALAGLLIAGTALALQLRSFAPADTTPPAQADVSAHPDGGNHIDLSSGTFHGPVTGTASTQVKADGTSAAAIGHDNSGLIITGANPSITLNTSSAGAATAGPALPPVAQVLANGLTALPQKASAVFTRFRPAIGDLTGLLRALVLKSLADELATRCCGAQSPRRSSEQPDRKNYRYVSFGDLPLRYHRYVSFGDLPLRYQEQPP